MKVIFIFMISFCFISCSNTNGHDYHIEMAGARIIKVKMQDLYPDYNGEEIDREVIEITILSKKHFIEESQRRGMTLHTYTGRCNNFKHIPTLASVRVYSNGKSSDYYAMGEIPRPDQQGIFHYKIYLRYEILKKLSQEEQLELCTEFGGNTYLFGYKSNRIKLELSQIEF